MYYLLLTTYQVLLTTYNVLLATCYSLLILLGRRHVSRGDDITNGRRHRWSSVWLPPGCCHCVCLEHSGGCVRLDVALDGAGGDVQQV